MLRLVILLIACTLSVTARADQVTMRNGDRLTGSLLHKSGDTLTLRTPYAGEIRLRMGEVASLVTDEPVLVVFSDGTVTHMRLAGEDVPMVDLDDLRYVNPTPEESGAGYLREGHVGLALTRTGGNSNTEQVHGEADLVLRAKTHRFTFGTDGNHGHDSGVTSTSNWRAKARGDYFFSPKNFLYARVGLENDRFKDIRLRNQVGGGYGYQIYEDESTTLDLRGGLAHVSVDHYALAGENYYAFIWGLDLRHRMDFYSGEFFHTQEGTQAFDNEHGTQLQTKTGLRLPLSEQVSATAQVNADWESRPAPGRRKLDTTLMFGLGYAFH